MTLVKIDIKNVASETHPDDKVVFRSDTIREAPDGGLVSTADEVVSLVDGVGELELVPGPVIVTFQCRGVADTRPKRGAVPDSGTVTVADVIGDSFTYTPGIVNQARGQINTARDEALGEVADAVTAALGREVVPHRIVNLIDPDATISGWLDPNGTVLAHASNRVTPLIPVDGGAPYVTRAPLGQHRAVWYNASQTAITGTDTATKTAGVPVYWTAPENAAFVRVGLALSTGQSLSGNEVLNRGTVLWEPDLNLTTGWWDDREHPPVEDRSVGLSDLDFVESGKIPHPVVDGAVPLREHNLFDVEDTTLATISGTNGNLVAHATNLTSGFIPVIGGVDYVSYHEEASRVVWFDVDKSFISGTNTDWIPSKTTQGWTAPPTAAFARMTMSVTNANPNVPPMIFNRGTVLWYPGLAIPTGWWDDRELPPVTAGGIDPDELNALVQAEVDKAVPHFEPSFPTLNFTSVYEGFDEPLWLSSDGGVLYGRRGRVLIQSTDEWENRQDVYIFETGATIQAVRSLGNGEIIVSLSGDVSTGRLAKLMRSTGYDRANPTVATWTQVLEAGSADAQINNSWGLHSYQNVVIAGEYGLWGETGARHVWLSEDYGQTFELVFDFKTDVPAGGPAWSTTAHVHTAAWDPYWSRIWIVCGDRPSTATYYSDDKGETWTYVEGSGHGGDSVQYTGIQALPDVVIFGSDAPPNGVFAYRRGQKSDMPVIKPLLLIDDSPEISRVFQLAYKRDWSPTSATYFAATPASDRAPSIIVGTVDGKKANILWEGEDPTGPDAFSGNVRFAFGPTVQGNVVAQMIADPTVTGTRVMKAPAPTWQRA